MRRLGFILFIVGLCFLIFSLVHWYINRVMAENRMLQGLDSAVPWFLLPAAAGFLIMVIGLCLQLLSRAPGHPEASGKNRTLDEEEDERGGV